MALISSSARAQVQTVIVRGVVMSATSGQGLPYSTVAVTGGLKRFTSADGSFSFALAPGNYTLRVRQLGFAPLDTTIVVEPAANARELIFRLQPVAFRLDAVRTYANSCSSGFGGDIEVLVAELSKNAEREKLLRSEYPFVYELERKNSYRTLTRTVVQSVDTAKYLSEVVEGYEPGHLVHPVDSAAPKGAREMRIPTLTDLADPVFISSHCFRFPGVETVDGARTYRIDFEPAKQIDAADVEGSAFIDSATYLIRKATFRLSKPEKLDPPVYGLEVTTLYREVFNGLALFDRIHSEQALARGAAGRATQLQDQRLIAIRFYGQTPEDVTIAQEPPLRKVVDSTARIAGTVVDSGGRALAHATILAVDAGARTTSSDSGKFLIAGLKPGRTQFRVQAIGFAPAAFTTELRAGRTRQMKIILTPTSVQLSTITVLDSLSDPLLGQTGFFTRKNRGIGGTFITPEEVEKRDPFAASDLLRTVNGVDVATSGHGTVPVSRRATLSGSCTLNVFIDGHPALMSSGMTLEDVVSGSEVGAMEVYPSALDTPARFLTVGSNCGALVIWTKGWLSPPTEPDSSGHE